MLKKALKGRKRTLKGAATVREINTLRFGSRRLQPAKLVFQQPAKLFSPGLFTAEDAEGRQGEEVNGLVLS
jgi:hypothetical protein